jgi:putative endonuclease
MRYTYIVKCNDGSLYTWITTDLERRIDEHNGLWDKPWAKYTKNKRPVELVWHKEVADRSEASKLEYAIKKMDKQSKQAIIWQK